MCGWALSTPRILHCLILTGVWLSCWDRGGNCFHWPSLHYLCPLILAESCSETRVAWGTTPSGLILVDAFRSLCSAEMRAARLRTGTREAGVLSGRENQGPSLASTLPNRTNDSSARVSTLCFDFSEQPGAGSTWHHSSNAKHHRGPQCGHSKQDMTKTPWQLNHQNPLLYKNWPKQTPVAMQWHWDGHARRKGR